MSNTIVKTDIIYSSELVVRILDGLTKAYPFISVISIGKSAAGSEIYVIKIGNGKKEFFINACMSANEWITSPLVLKFCEDIAENINKKDKPGGCNYSIAELLENVSVYISPMANPDGVDFVNGFFKGILKDNAEYISENYPHISFPNEWRANILGTELNLNFPANWVKARRLKYSKGLSSPAPYGFVGFYPLSAPESKCVYEFTLNRDFALMIDLQTIGNKICCYSDLADFERTMHIGNILAEASGFGIEDSSESCSFGSYRDWFSKNYNRPGFIVKCGNGKNPLSLSEFNEMYDSVRLLFLSAIESIYKIL